MSPWLLLLLAQAPTSPTDLPSLRARLLAGDLVTIERARPHLAERGAFGLLVDLSRFSRCLPLAALPANETARYRALRALVRLERVRLTQLMRDGAHRDSPIAALLGAGSLLATRPLRRSASLVYWPFEEERWLDEADAPLPEPSECPQAPGAARERDKKTYQAASAKREAVERRMRSRLLKYADALPPAVGAKLAVSYLLDVEAAGLGFEIPSRWRERLFRASDGGPAPLRTAGLIRLAKRSIAQGEPQLARACLRRILQLEERTDEEDGQARVLLVSLVEPDWDEVLKIAQGARAPRALERYALRNAQARAWYSLGDAEALKKLGRRWLREEAPLSDRFNAQTDALLVRFALGLAPSEALAWIQELAGASPRAQHKRLEAFGELALVEGDSEMAASVFDHLLVKGVSKGPRGVSARARFLASRAVVEYTRDDAEAFGGFIEQLVEIAQKEERPLARTAPHRELAKVTQRLFPKLLEDVPAAPSRRRYAALLLEAASQMRKLRNRFQRALARYEAPLSEMAGPYANKAWKPKKKPKRPLKQLGQVRVPRLPPKLKPPVLSTPAPALGTFLVYETPDGQLINEVPWRALMRAPAP